MTSANLDLVRSIQEAWQRGDFSSADWAHPEIEYVHVDGPAPGTWTGRAGLARAFGDFLRAWENWRVEAEQYRELDDERVLVLQRFDAHGKTSGVDARRLRTQVASLFYVRDGEVTRLVQYFDRDRALAELGLSPETGSPGS